MTRKSTMTGKAGGSTTGVDWPDRRAVEAAARRIAPHVEQTPLSAFPELNAALDCDLRLKCENRQAGGAFKARGACNAVFSLSEDQAAHGVATHSSGNHGAALARAARLRGIAAHIVMPRGAATPKREAVASWGARIIECEATMDSRVTSLNTVLQDSGATLVHPYEDSHVMAGQGTVAMEILPELREGDCLLVPVGGGGLISGIACYLAEAMPGLRIIGVEPAGADDTLRSLEAGKLTPVRPETVADGLRATVGQTNLDIIREHVTAVVTVEEAAIVDAMMLIWRTTGMRVEPSGAVTVAALMQGRVDKGGRLLGVITGGNVDTGQFHFS